MHAGGPPKAVGIDRGFDVPLADADHARDSVGAVGLAGLRVASLRHVLHALALALPPDAGDAVELRDSAPPTPRLIDCCATTTGPRRSREIGEGAPGAPAPPQARFASRCANCLRNFETFGPTTIMQ